LLIFSGYFWILAVFDRNRSFLYHGQDLLKFGFFLNLTASSGAISFKESGGCKNCFYSISGTSCDFRASMIYAGKEISQRFSATFPGHVEISGRAAILNTDFLPLNYRGTLF